MLLITPMVEKPDQKLLEHSLTCIRSAATVGGLSHGRHHGFIWKTPPRCRVSAIDLGIDGVVNCMQLWPNAVSRLAPQLGEPVQHHVTT